MRSSLKYALNKLGNINKAVEIGQRVGNNAVQMLKADIQELYLIDPYLPYKDDSQKEEILINQEMQNVFKQRMLSQIAQYGNRVRILNISSQQAALVLQNDFDYVYIDGDHHYENVLADISTWYPKTKVLAGHDFKNLFPGVMKAVIEFARINNLKIVTNSDSDWWYKNKQLRVVSYFCDIDKFKPYREYLNNFRASVTKNGYELSCYDVDKEIIGVSLVNKEDVSKPGCCYYVQGRRKPEFIAKALDDFQDDIVYMDIDCVIQNNLGNPLCDCDVAVTLRRIDDRFGKKFFEGYLNTGVMFFKNNDKARKFCQLWQSEIKELECDQDGANKLLLNFSNLEKFNEIIDIDGIKIKILPAEEYNFFYFPEDSSKAKVLHYKGMAFKGVYKK